MKNRFGLEVYFLWEIKRDGAVKDAPTFCCLGDVVNLEKMQGTKEDDVSMGPVEFSCSGAIPGWSLGPSGVKCLKILC